MRNNKELLEKIKLMNQAFKLGEAEAFQVAVNEAAYAAFKSVLDAFNPVQDTKFTELISLIPALKVVTEFLENSLDEEKKLFAEEIYVLKITQMKLVLENGEKENGEKEKREMRNNEELLEKTENKLSQIFGDDAAEVFMVALSKVAEAALESVKDAINPVQEEELIFLIPALKIFTDFMEELLDDEEKLIAKEIYSLMKTLEN